MTYEITEAPAVPLLGHVEKIKIVEQALLGCADVAVLPVKHHVGEVKGVYLREGRIKADKYVLGHRHTTPHYMVILKGRMLMAEDDRVTEMGPGIYLCSPGRRKLAKTLEEVWGFNIMGTDQTSIPELEEELVITSDLYKEWLLLQKPVLVE